MPPSPSAVPMTLRTWPPSPSSWPRPARETSPASRSTSTAALFSISRYEPGLFVNVCSGHMLPLTLPTPPTGARDSKESGLGEFFRSLSPIGGEGRVRGQTRLHECSATYLLLSNTLKEDSP